MNSQSSSETMGANTLPEEELRAWLHLANIQLSTRLLIALLDHFQHNPQALLNATDAELMEVAGFQAKHGVRLRDPVLKVTDRQWAWIEKHPIQLLLSHKPGYPRLLQEIPDPPPLLFMQGTLLESDRFSVGMVGSRQATPYGKTIAERLARELGGQGLTIVSGGAMGIDAMAHRGALAGGGRTIAVLGCGLDVDYPRENRPLFEQIVASGALITEYPLGAQPEAWRFPLRNRLLSGLSQGVVVIEAPRRSGALITSRYAMEEHGRPVMVVPANIDRPSSVGSNELLKEGVAPVTEMEDVLRALNILVLPARPEHQRALSFEDAAESDAKGEPARTKGNVRPQASTSHLPPEQQKLLTALSLTPRHLDAVAQEVGMTVVEVGVAMTLMELDGLVRRLPGNTYIRTL